MEKYRKLVRDKIPSILDIKGIPYEKEILNDSEYESEIIKKLFEEVEEFRTDLSVEELADVIEVLEYIKKLPQYKDLESIRIQKKEERGGFDKKILLSGEK